MRKHWHKIEDEEGEEYTSNSPFEAFGSLIAIAFTVVFIIPAWVWSRLDKSGSVNTPQQGNIFPTDWAHDEF